MQTGVVLHFKNNFGHIKIDDALPDIFVHKSDVQGFVHLQAGDQVSFDVSSRHNRKVATNVRRTSAAPKIIYVPAPPRGNFLEEYVKSVADLNPQIPEKFTGAAESAATFRPQRADRIFK